MGFQQRRSTQTGWLAAAAAVDQPFTQTAWPPAWRPAITQTAVASRPSTEIDVPIGEAAFPKGRSAPPSVPSVQLPNLLLTTLGDIDKPFVQRHWPGSVRPTARQSYQWTRGLYLTDQKPIGTTLTAIPAVASRTTTTVRTVPSEAAVVVGEKPFKQTEWPVAFSPKGARASIVTAPPGEPVFEKPFKQTDWPGLRPPRPPDTGWITAYISESEKPFRQTVWPGAIPAKPQPPRWSVWSRSRTLVEPKPSGTTEMRGVLRVTRPVQWGTWSRSLALVESLPIGKSALAPPQPRLKPPTVPPENPVTRFSAVERAFTQTSWLGTRTDKQPIRWGLWARPLALIDEQPIGAREFGPTRTLQTPPALVVPNLLLSLLDSGKIPFSQTDWPGTVRIQRPTLWQTWSRTLGLEESLPIGRIEMAGPSVAPPTVPWSIPRNIALEPEPGNPFIQTDWPGVVRVRQPGYTHLWWRQIGLDEDETPPLGEFNQWPGVHRVKPPGLTWLQARPVYYDEPFPVGQAEMRGARRGVPGVPAVLGGNLNIVVTPLPPRPIVNVSWPLSQQARRTIPTDQVPLGPWLIPEVVRQKAGCMLVGSYSRVIDLEGSA